MYTICYNFTIDTLTYVSGYAEKPLLVKKKQNPKTTRENRKSMTELSTVEGKLQKVKNSKEVPI